MTWKVLQGLTIKCWDFSIDLLGYVMFNFEHLLITFTIGEVQNIQSRVAIYIPRFCLWSLWDFLKQFRHEVYQFQIFSKYFLIDVLLFFNRFDTYSDMLYNVPHLNFDRIALHQLQGCQYKTKTVSLTTLLSDHRILQLCSKVNESYMYKLMYYEHYSLWWY